MLKTQSFLLVLAASFLIILIYVTSHISQYGPEDLLGTSFQTTRIIVVGDTMLGRSVMTASLKADDPRYPFRKVAPRLNSVDIVFANLESPFVEGCIKTDTGMIFCADPSLVAGLKYTNIGIVGLANNHINNYGAKGIVDTKRILTEAKIDYAGEGNLAIEVKNGVKFGFLAFNFVGNSPTVLDYKMVADSAKTVDALLVSVHWGEEYKSTANSNQQVIAKKLIENGADVIIGHHPHWVQNYEEIDGKPVYYSLGNFVFDQMWSEKTKEGLAIELTFEGSKLTDKKQLPLKIDKTGQPEFIQP